MALLSDTAFEAYKRRMVPVLYDWFMHYHLSYPTQTCRWGQKVEDAGYKAKYRAYLSEQVWDKARPDTLILAHVVVLKPHVASCEAVSNWQEKSSSQHVTIVKTVYHPGEVNKVREVPQHPQVVVTHTDSKKLFVWNMDRQPDRRPQSGGVAAAAGKARKSTDKGGDKGEPSVADLVLVGHEDEAPFPLSCSTSEPMVASGGNDNLVLLWDLADSVTSLTSAEGPAGRRAPELKARTRLAGHTATVDDLVFQPGSSAVLISVADDGKVLTWDTRAGLTPAAEVEDAHGPGVNVMCVDWCPLDEHMVVTGAQAGSLKVWDRRRMTAAVREFDAHKNSEERDIIHVEWHPSNKNVFASGSNDHTVAIWDLERAEPEPSKVPATSIPSAATEARTEEGAGPAGGAEAAGTSGGAEGEKEGPPRKRVRTGKEGAGGGKGRGGSADQHDPELVFQHLGHRLGRVTDFQWHPDPAEPWTIISVSDHSTDDVADGSLQVWRINDLIYRPFEEAQDELDQHRQFILTGSVVPPTDSKVPKDKEREKSKDGKDVKQEKSEAAA